MAEFSTTGGILMTIVHNRVLRELGQVCQGSVHLLGSSFEEATASSLEESITGGDLSFLPGGVCYERHHLPREYTFLPSTILQEEADTVLGMARRVQALDFDVTSGQLKLRLVLDDGVCAR